MSVWRLLQNVHGLVAVLGLAACLHPVWLLRTDRAPSSRTVLAARLASALVLAAVALAFVIYPTAYRSTVRGWLLLHHPSAHQVWFEMKEALGFFAVTGVVGGAALVGVARRSALARRAARRAYLLSVIAGGVALLIGVAVASLRDLGD